MFKDDYDEYVKLSEKTVSSLGDSDISEAELINIEYDTYKSASNLFIIKLGVAFLYFGIIQFLWNGKTIGKKIFRLRIIPMGSTDLRPGLFILRSLIVNNIILDICSVLSLICGSKGVWLIVNSLTGIISYLISFVILFFMFYRSDGRSIHDMICKTAVILEK